VGGSDHARAQVVTGGLGDELADTLPCRTTQLAEQLAAMKEKRSQELGHGEGSQTVTHLLDDFFPEKGSEHRPSLGRAGRAESATGTGEGEEILPLASITEDASEAVLVVAAVEEGVDDLVDEAAPAAA